MLRKTKEKNIVEKKYCIEILDFNLNEQIRKGQGLKLPTPSQMLNRLPISLAQLKAGNNSKKKELKMKLDNYCILCNVQKN